VREFKGVEHRLEYVREVHGVAFYNNSKATSVDAAVKSLEAFDRGVHLILGGKDKGAPYAPLRPLLKDRVREVLLIGAAADRIAQELAGTVELVGAGNLESAVREAFQRARPGDVVLLAPACSSFDQFQDYEHRGRVFKELVERLAEAIESGSEDWKWTTESPAGPTKQAPEESPGPRAGTVSQEVEKSDLVPAPDAGAKDEAKPLTEAQPHELTYDFEIGAQEFPPGDIELAQDYPHEAGVGRLPVPLTPDMTDDAQMPYEARESASRNFARDASKDEPKASEDRPTREHGSGPDSSAHDSARQLRLPELK
jgi:hypothetical protein